MRCFPQSPKEGGLWGGAMAAWEVGVWDGAGLTLLGKNCHLIRALTETEHWALLPHPFVPVFSITYI